LAAHKEIVDLVEWFESNLASYKSGHYNETQVRPVDTDSGYMVMCGDELTKLVIDFRGQLQAQWQRKLQFSGSTTVGLLAHHKTLIHTTKCYPHESTDHMLICHPNACDSGVCSVRINFAGSVHH
jgi:hypothetical protein